MAFKLFHEIGPRYKERSGGYTRIYKLAKVRQGDAAPMAVIALLGENEAIKAPGQAGRRRFVSRRLIKSIFGFEPDQVMRRDRNHAAARSVVKRLLFERRSVAS